MKFSEEQKKLRTRILEITHKAHTSHLGSCLSAIDAIDAIYTVKKRNDPFVLSNGHAGVALYAVLEKHRILSNPVISDTFFIHPDRNLDLGIYVSTGSLGQGLPIAVGMCFANRKRNVYCMISDGECTEGSIWEAFRIAVDYKLDNLKIVLNANGWGAYDKISLSKLYKRIKGFGLFVITVDGHNTKQIIKTLKKQTNKKPLLVFAKTKSNQFPFLKNQRGHYHVMSDEEYKKALEKLKV